MEISILAAGSWATALANVLSDKYDVLMYARNIKDCDNINKYHINKKYFPEIKLRENIRATNNIKDVFKNKYIVNAIPTQSIREVFSEIGDFFTKDHVIINVSKGLELNTHLRISQVIKEYAKDSKYAVLSGPSHAEEVIKEIPTAIVCASEDKNVQLDIQNIFSRDYFRIYTSDDVIGVEFSSSIKNILAFGIGMATGLEFGDNTKAVLMTRGIHEMNLFSTKLGANPKTINGLAGIGDLIVTATSMHSRNNRCGILIGKGYSVDDAIKEIKMVVEGIPTTKSVYELSKDLDIELPITNEIYSVIYENKDPRDSVSDLMNRQRKSEY